MSVEEAILPVKITELVTIISKKKKLGSTDALAYLYTSDFYLKLQNADSKWWYMSGLNLYHELEKEKQKQLHAVDARVKLFFVFCTENYKAKTGLDAIEILTLFNKYDVYKFLADNYDILHTQGEDYILDEISAYIKKRKQR